MVRETIANLKEQHEKEIEELENTREEIINSLLKEFDAERKKTDSRYLAVIDEKNQRIKSLEVEIEKSKEIYQTMYVKLGRMERENSEIVNERNAFRDALISLTKII